MACVVCNSNQIDKSPAHSSSIKIMWGLIMKSFTLLPRQSVRTPYAQKHGELFFYTQDLQGDIAAVSVIIIIFLKYTNTVSWHIFRSTLASFKINKKSTLLRMECGGSSSVYTG